MQIAEPHAVRRAAVERELFSARLAAILSADDFQGLAAVRFIRRRRLWLRNAIFRGAAIAQRVARQSSRMLNN